MYLLLAGLVLASALSSQSQQIATQIQLAGLAMTLNILLWIVLIWYVAFSTGTKSLLLLDLLTAAWLVFLIRNVSSPHGLLSAGMASTAHVSAESWWSAVKFTMLASLLFCFYAAARKLRLGDRPTTLVLLCGLSILLTSSLADHLLNASVGYSLTVAPFGFMGFLLAHSLYYILLDFRQRLVALPAPITYRLTFDPRLISFQSTLSELQPTLPPQGEPETTVPPPQECAAATHRTSSPSTTVNPDGETVVRHPTGHLPSDKRAVAAETDIGRMGSADHAGGEVRRRDNRGSTATHKQSALNIVSDNLIDIAVWATIVRNRFKRGNVDPQALETLCRKIRNKAIKTRRMANNLSRPGTSG